MNKQQALQACRFGKRIAEEEVDALASYFVRTNLYSNILAGDLDVIYGAKGSGKSAIYFSLIKAENDLFEKGVLIKSAENPRGAPAFKDLIADPPVSHDEFRGLWKLYLLTLIGSVLRECGINNTEAKKVIAYLEDAKLLPPSGGTLSSFIRRSLDYVRCLLRLEGITGGVTIDPQTGMINGLTGKISLREPSGSSSMQGLESIDSLCGIANTALASSGYKIWILLDRLDVAFAESTELESNALRALFTTYLDFSGYDSIHLKIFLRSDIWKKITESGFRESSHITRHATITWTELSLLNLVVRRLLNNPSVLQYYNVNEEEVLRSLDAQEELFYRVFPDKVDLGQRKAKTFDWMLSRVRDGLGIAAPRELIHLLTCLQENQLSKFDMGSSDPAGEALFDRTCFKEAMIDVSRVRTEQTLYAEYPDTKPWIESLRGQKAEQVMSTLVTIWNVPAAEAEKRAQKLVDIGFFELLGSKTLPRFRVPFLYRDYVDLVQGRADGVSASGNLEESDE